MSISPETRPSLLVRLADRGDEAAWFEFAQIYTPVVKRLARRKGMQAADADDLAQQVLTAVSKSIERWQVDPERGHFRTWLYRVTQNLIINAFTRRVPDRGAGDSDVSQQLYERAAPDTAVSEQVRLEFRREIFRLAANEIRVEFSASSWKAFWLTAVEDQEVREVANQLNLSCGAVYTARSRVMKRLREKVAELQPRDSEV
jgi:RNA polymerase sigma-70 factor, ECF subfamily